MKADDREELEKAKRHERLETRGRIFIRYDKSLEPMTTLVLVPSVTAKKVKYL